MARLKGLRALTELVRSELTGEPRRLYLITTAGKLRDEVLAHNVRVLGSSHVEQTLVDGREGQLSQMRVGGVVAFLFDAQTIAFEKAVDELYQLLLELSPVLKGTYQESHLFLINGVQHTANPGDAPTRLKMTDVVSFTNLVPYARKIEKGQSSQAPNGVYEVAAATIQARYGSQSFGSRGGILQIRFSYRPYPGHEVGPSRRGGRLKTRADFHRARSYPTIEMAIRGAAE